MRSPNHTSVHVPMRDGARETVEILRQLLRQICANNRAQVVAVQGVSVLGIDQAYMQVSSLRDTEHLTDECLREVAAIVKAYDSREPVVFIEDVSVSVLREVDSVETCGVRSAAFVPLDLPSAPKAVLVLLWFRESRSYSSDELENLIFSARLVSILCKSIQIMKTSSEQSHKLSALVELSTTIYSSLSYQVVLQKVIDLASSLVSASYATIYILSPDEERLSPLLTSAKSGHDAIMQRDIPIGRGPEGRAASLGEGVIANGLPPEQGAPKSGGGSRIAVPLIFSGSAIGVLSVHRASGDLFSLDDLQFLAIFARQAADVIENARMYKDLKEAYDKLSRTQEQMLETEKLRALGEMACAVAHDFNNNLGSILGRAQLLQRETTDAGLVAGLKEIENLALKGSESVRRTQEFARVRSKTAKKRVSINEVVREAVETTRPIWKDQAQLNMAEIEMNLDLKATQPLAGSAGELVDALSNMIQNSVEALPHGGLIDLATFDRDDSVVLSVCDDGVGMAQEVRDKIFYPFFSTKGKGKTGLGMSVAYGILSRHQARVEIESVEGEGTTIKIAFPARPDLRETGAIPTAADDVRKLRVLVIDDDESLLNVVKELLVAIGHEPTVAKDGMEGLSIFDESSFDFVITDLGLPGMSGWDVAKAVKLKRQSLPVMIISGWGAQIAEDDVSSRGVDMVLSKPFTVTQLRDAINQIFAGKTVSA